MKLYIIITADIHPVGGMQSYVSGKTKYLLGQGWKVLIFFGGVNTGKCAYPVLNSYVSGGFRELLRQPYEWPGFVRNNVLNKMISLTQTKNNNYKQIIVESQSDLTSLWGEMIAEKIQAKHYCFLCNEIFRGSNKHYLENLDFFNFKLQRLELAGIHSESLSKLFDGYENVLNNNKHVFFPANEEAVQDVTNSKINDIEKKDFNICYIGRARKNYVPIIIEDIGNFSRKNKGKSIQLIFVGNADERKELLDCTFKSVNNVSLILLGDLVPIPKILFSKIDVVIAGAGSAEYVVDQGVPVIVADAENYLANGILGYTTFNSLFCETDKKQMHYDEILESVLIDRIQDKYEFHMANIKKSSECYNEQFDLIKRSTNNKEYFSLNKNVRKITLNELIKFYFEKFSPNIFLTSRSIYKRIKRGLNNE